MSMDFLLRTEAREYVSLPVFFGAFSACTAQNELNPVDEKNQEETDVVEKLLIDERMSQVTADLFQSSIDNSDIRSTASASTKLDNTKERNNLTSQKHLIHETNRRRNPQYKSIALRALRYDYIEKSVMSRHSPFCVVDPEDKIDLNLDSNLIVNVSIYIGYSRELTPHEVRLGRRLKVTDRIELSGCHTLLELKNAFSCPSEYRFTEDFSQKQPTPADFSKNKYAVSFFFIHDTFYVDNPDNNTDPSETIRNWAATKSSVGEMHVKDMRTTRLDQLTARLGQPYVFIHQGTCEHLIVFNELSHRNESYENAVLPRHIFERNFRRINCNVCRAEYAHWAILQHQNLLPNCPGYLCTDCYHELCFDAQNNKVEDFIAVPYCDRKEVCQNGMFLPVHRF
ncbi:unnamed protein product [Caenorhabditis angaria]|uniref:snRNA-activating protein complex subunit 3 n=1 Tax=Caenorhabditis angaria TaxID=860376 RepID=A0A9P1MXT8_9PELO|nr:unnamed protein product [Caenorhabditis angaria]